MCNSGSSRRFDCNPLDGFFELKEEVSGKRSSIYDIKKIRRRKTFLEWIAGEDLVSSSQSTGQPSNVLALHVACTITWLHRLLCTQGNQRAND